MSDTPSPDTPSPDTPSPDTQRPDTLGPDDLADLVTRTVADYGSRTEAFWAGTRDHDVSQNRAALIGALAGAGPHVLLDFGCGPGRDLKAFTELGHTAIGIDGTEPFVTMAREWSGCEVWHQNFLDLRLPAAKFDGIFANASLFHVPSQELPRVLGELRAALKADGVLFSSNPCGHNEEGWHGNRYGVFHDLAAWQGLLAKAGFVEVSHYFRPEGVPREDQRWLAGVWRRR